MFSDEYYAEFFPKVKCESSKKNHKNVWNLLRKADSVESFLDVSDTGGRINRAHFLRPLKDHYVDFNDDEWFMINEIYQDALVERAMGEQVYAKEIDYDSEFKKLDASIEIFRNNLNDCKIDNLFGGMLPPRRQDLYRLEIRKEYTTSDINFYCQKDMTFYFHSDENKKKVDQSFPLLKLAPLYKQYQPLYKRIVAYLQSLPEGRIYKGTNVARSVQSYYGVSNTTLRKYWQTRAPDWFDINQRRILNEWMDQCPKTILSTYKK